MFPLRPSNPQSTVHSQLKAVQFSPVPSSQRSRLIQREVEAPPLPSLAKCRMDDSPRSSVCTVEYYIRYWCALNPTTSTYVILRRAPIALTACQETTRALLSHGCALHDPPTPPTHTHTQLHCIHLGPTPN